MESRLILSVEDRIAAGYLLCDMAKRDIIFVYRKVESDPTPKHTVENICARIEKIALSKQIQPTTGASSFLFGVLNWQAWMFVFAVIFTFPLLFRKL